TDMSMKSRLDRGLKILSEENGINVPFDCVSYESDTDSVKKIYEESRIHKSSHYYRMDIKRPSNIIVTSNVNKSIKKNNNPIRMKLVLGVTPNVNFMNIDDQENN